MLNITHYQRNANQNYNEISPHTSQNGYHQKNLQTINVGGRWIKGQPLTLLVRIKLIQLLWRTILRFLYKLGIKLPYNPKNTLLGLYPEKTITEKEICTPVLIAALFTIARTWKQPRCPSTHEKMLSFTYYQKNANQNHNEVSCHTGQNDHHQKVNKQ